MISVAKNVYVSDLASKYLAPHTDGAVAVAALV